MFLKTIIMKKLVSFLFIASTLFLQSLSAQKQNTSGLVQPMMNARPYNQTFVSQSHLTGNILNTSRLFPRAKSNHVRNYKPVENEFTVYATAFYEEGDWGNIYGIYSFTNNASSEPALLATDMHFASSDGKSYGAYYIDGDYYVKELRVMGSGEYAFVMNNTYVYDTETWTSVSQMANPTKYDGIAWAATALNPNDDLAYGTFYSEDGSKGTWGIYNPVTQEHIYTDYTPAYYVLAFNSKGVLYGIDFEGNFGTVDTANGEMDVISSLPLVPSEYRTGAIIDSPTNIMFTHIITDDGYVHACNIDLASGDMISDDILSSPTQYIGWFTIPEAEYGAPAQPENLSAYFADGSLDGTISFDVPTTTYGGDVLPDERLEYKVFIGTEEIASGYTYKGEKVNVHYTVQNEGNYVFNVVVINSVGKSPYASVSYWVGPATPIAIPESKAVKFDDHTIEVEWKGVSYNTENVEIDPTQISYTVTRMPDNVVVADDIKETKLTDYVEYDGRAKFQYRIVANYGDNSSEATLTNHVTFGYIEPAYTNDFDNDYMAKDFTVIDENRDGSTWSYNYVWKAMTNSYCSTGNNDWLISEPVALKKGVYRIEISAVSSTYSAMSKLKVAVGDTQSVDDMTTVVMESFDVDGAYIVEGIPDIDVYNYSMELTVDKDGDYYVGLNDCSVAIPNIQISSQLILKSFSIIECDMNAPAAVDDMKVVAGESGGLKAEISFVLPKYTIRGDALDAVSKTEILKDGVLIYTVRDKNPGDMCTFTDTNFDEPCMADYSVVAYNADGSAGKEASASIWVGVDTPLSPKNVRLEDNGDGTFLLSWEKPSTGQHGGYIDYSKLVYSYGELDEEWQVVTNIKETTELSAIVKYENVNDVQDILIYSVSASNEIGLSYWMNSNPQLCGEAYDLPLRESFANLSVSSVPWMFVDQIGEGIWFPTWYVSQPVIFPQDDDKGLLVYSPSGIGDAMTVCTPRVSLENTTNPVVSFYVYNDEDTNIDYDLQVSAYKDYFESVSLTTVKTVDMAKDGWVRYDIPLQNINGWNDVFIGFRAVTNGVSDVLALDNIRIFDYLDYDLEVMGITAPESIPVGETGVVSCEIANYTKNDFGEFTVVLNADGVPSQSKTFTGLKKENRMTVEFEVTPNIKNPKVCNYSVEIITKDDNMKNNISEEVMVEQPQPNLPTVENLTAVPCTNGVKLEWSEAPNEYKDRWMYEGFEEYDSFATDALDGWVTVDKDGNNTRRLEGASYPHAGEPGAGMVFKAKEVRTSNPYTSPHAGENMFVMWQSEVNEEHEKSLTDDWLISPELTGEKQSVSFFFKSMCDDDYVLEIFQIYYSTSDGDVDSMVPLTDKIEFANNDWERFKFSVPEGTKYFAIRYTSAYYGLALCLDDFTFERNEEDGILTPLQLLGYNVYCSGLRVNDSPVAATEFLHKLNSAGRFTYGVTAVYDLGESDFGDTAEVMITESDIQDVLGGDIYVMASDKEIQIFNAENLEVKVYEMSGAIVYSGYNVKTVHVESGLYLVYVGDKAFKVSVK